jgi:hypothetical protein
VCQGEGCHKILVLRDFDERKDEMIQLMKSFESSIDNKLMSNWDGCMKSLVLTNLVSMIYSKWITIRREVGSLARYVNYGLI